MSAVRKGYLADFVKAVLRGIWAGFGITDTAVIVIIVLLYLGGQVGLSGGFEEHPPGWLITALAVIFIGFEILRSTYQLYVSERAQREASQAKKQPTTPLAELVTHIVGTDDLGKPGVPQMVSDALTAIREKASLGLLSTWGRRDAN